MNNNPIGVFDSGVGGLTAMQELTTLLPNEHIIYLGDSHNMPYGEKTRDEIVSFSQSCLEFLLGRGVKAVFVACGTATVNALDILKSQSGVPVFGVVDAAAQEALSATENGRIGVLATRASIRAQTYQRRLKELKSGIIVEARACPVFATMVEYGIFDKNDEMVRRAAQEYLPPLKEAQVDTVLLGCTHYPLLSEVIKEYVGANVRLISSGAAAARSLAAWLEESGMAADENVHKLEYFTTGEKESFANSAFLMLRRDISGELIAIKPLN